jgi:hypothetical protein
VPRHPPNALIALDPKLRNVTRRDKSLRPSLSLRSLSTFRIADRRHLGRHARHHPRMRTTGARTSRKDPAYGQPHFPIHDVKDRDELAIAVGQRPSIDHSSQFRQTLRTPSRSALAPLLAPIVGGADRTRTGDPLLAKQVLSQLSYSPIQIPGKLVGPGRFELPTSRLSSARSNQLSYEPDQTTEDGRHNDRVSSV